MANDNFDDFQSILNKSKKKEDEKQLSDYLMSKLTNKQTDEINRILNDKNALDDLLSSEKAQSILKKLTGDKNG